MDIGPNRISAGDYRFCVRRSDAALVAAGAYRHVGSGDVDLMTKLIPAVLVIIPVIVYLALIRNLEYEGKRKEV